MNERIHDLVLQARYDSRNEQNYLERVHNREITLDEYQEIYDKKFAELIVQECAKHAEHAKGTDVEFETYFKAMVFGVEP